MYFSEFLETCTIGWASFCEGRVGIGKESAFFILVGEDGAHHPPPPARPIYPRGGDPSPQRTRTDCTAQAAAQTVPDARQTARSKPRTDTHAQTLDTLRREIGTAADAGLPAMCPEKCTISDVYFYPYLYGYILSKALTIHIYMDII